MKGGQRGRRIGLGTYAVKRESAEGKGAGWKEGAQVSEGILGQREMCGNRRRGAGTCAGRKGVRAAPLEQGN